MKFEVGWATFEEKWRQRVGIAWRVGSRSRVDVFPPATQMVHNDTYELVITSPVWPYRRTEPEVWWDWGPDCQEGLVIPSEEVRLEV